MGKFATICGDVSHCATARCRSPRPPRDPAPGPRKLDPHEDGTRIGAFWFPRLGDTPITLHIGTARRDAYSRVNRQGRHAALDPFWRPRYSPRPDAELRSGPKGTV